jgi:glycosyltransferase involved in cell wall biosynthesis
MKLKNVIIVNDFAHVNGGAGQVAFSSAKELAHRGFNVVVFSAVAPIDESLKFERVKVVCLAQKDILTEKNRLRAIVQGCWNKKAYDAFKDLLRVYSPSDTIIHLHGWMKALSPSILAVTAKTNFKVVLTLHDYFTFCPNGGLFNYQTKQICKIKPSSFSCLCTDCDSRSYLQKVWRFIRQIFQNYYLRKNRNLTIVYISETNRKVSERSLLRVAKKWYFVQNPVTISGDVVEVVKNEKYLFMGRLSEEKGCELFCQAMKDLNLKGIVVGDGYLKKELERKFPNVEFKGWLSGEEKRNVVSSAKCFVFPSLWYEGAPLTIVEMKSRGVPCVVPDSCAASEEIEDGISGCIFESGRLDSLKTAILKIEWADLQLMQNNIIKSFDAPKYSLKSHADSLIAIYDCI